MNPIPTYALNRTISLSYLWYTGISSETATINYGDSTVSTVTIAANSSAYAIPTGTISSPIALTSATNLLLLNNEFHYSTSVYGFELYASTAGQVALSVNKIIFFKLKF